MATMGDIAKRLGITKGTVSKALSGADDVSESMRKLVVETAVEMGYSRILRSNDPPRLCVFIANMSYQHPNDFGWDIVTGFRKLAEPDGYAVVIQPLSKELQRQYHYDEYMMLHNYQGALFLGMALPDPWISEFRSCRTPTVLLDNQPQYNPVVSQVGIDNDEGMEMAIRQLIALGHNTIGYLGGGPDSYVYQERHMAFFRALRKYNLKEDPTLAGCDFDTAKILNRHLPRLLEAGCTAILCSHDLLARDVMEHCITRRTMRIPQDLSIVGIDDLPICLETRPTLSTIRQDRAELGKSAYYALSSQLSRIHISLLRLHPELMIRGSIGKAPKKAK